MIERFKNIVRLASNGIEFHIVSYAAWSKIESTRSAAQYLINHLVSHALPFKRLHFAKHPCGKEGKSSIVAALQAHCLVDDRQDVLNEKNRTGIKVLKHLSWLVLSRRVGAK